MADGQLGLGWLGFTATSNRVQTTAIRQEFKQIEQNKKEYESSNSK